MKSGIASFPQQLRQGNNPLGQGLEIVRAVEGLAGFGGLAGDPIGNMNSGGILTGEDSGTTGRTNRASRIGLGKHGGFRSQLVEVGVLWKVLPVNPRSRAPRSSVTMRIMLGALAGWICPKSNAAKSVASMAMILYKNGHRPGVGRRPKGMRGRGRPQKAKI